MNEKKGLTQPNFDALLAWFDPDRDQAGIIYIQIRKRVVKYFECRGRHDAEELADTTINRVALKVPEIAKDYVGDKALYFYGVAHKVFLESLRKPPPIPSQPVVNFDDAEKEDECLARCMSELNASDRDVVLDYYQFDKGAKIEHRRALAEKQGVAQNALRLRAHRIRLKLLPCLLDCLAQAA